MDWLVNVYADVLNGFAAKPLMERSPIFSGWESVGGTQRRITLTVPETDAADAEAACDFAETEVKDRLSGYLNQIDNSAATRLEV